MRLKYCRIDTRKVTNDTISEKDICSKIITEAPKMYMLAIRTLQNENRPNPEIEDL